MRTLQEDIHAANTYSVDSNGKAVCWSGGYGNYLRAQEYAHQNKAVTLERTTAGRALNGVFERNNLRFPKNQVESDKLSHRITTVASKRFAQNASGDVKTFVCGARPNSVFRKTELPSLLRNKKVTSINGIDRSTLAKMHKDNPDRAFRAVCLAELRQDRREAKQMKPKTDKDKKLQASRLASVRERHTLYKGTHDKNQKTPVLASVRNQQNLNVPSNRQSTPEFNRSNTANSTQSKSPTKTQPPPPPPQQSQKRGR